MKNQRILRSLPVFLAFGGLWAGLTGCSDAASGVTPRNTDAEGWGLVGGAFNSDPKLGCEHPSIAVYQGAPIVAWTEYTPDGRKTVLVKRWIKPDWVPLGEALESADVELAELPSIQVTPQGVPVVAFDERGVAGSHIAVKKWDGQSWQPAGPVIVGPNGSSTNASLVLDNSGTPIVSWLEQVPSTQILHVSRLEDGAWAQVGNAITTRGKVTRAVIGLDNSAKLTVAFSQELPTEPATLHVQQLLNANWLALGDVLNVDPALSALEPALAMDLNGNPTVAWSERSASASSIFVKQFVNGSWVQRGASVNDVVGATVATPSIAIDPKGTPVAVWDQLGALHEAPVKKWIVDHWAPLGPSLEGVSRTPASPVLALDTSPSSGAEPLVATVSSSNAGFALKVARFKE